MREAWDRFLQARSAAGDERLLAMEETGLTAEQFYGFFLQRCQFSDLPLKPTEGPRPDLGAGRGEGLRADPRDRGADSRPPARGAARPPDGDGSPPEALRRLRGATERRGPGAAPARPGVEKPDRGGPEVLGTQGQSGTGAGAPSPRQGPARAPRRRPEAPAERVAPVRVPTHRRSGGRGHALLPPVPDGIGDADLQRPARVDGIPAARLAGGPGEPAGAGTGVCSSTSSRTPTLCRRRSSST